MWSASGLLGSRPASQVRRTWQMGQCSSPAARAERLAAAALWSQRVVPVREVVTCPPRACAHAGRVVLLCTCGPRRFSPFPSPQKGRQQWSPATVWVGWALTLCLCSYDARFSSSVQVGVLPGVLRFSHRAGVFCCGVPPIVDTPPPALIPPPPRLMGVPLFCVGVGCLLRPPLCCGLPHCLHAPPGLAFIVYGDIHLSHRERTRYPPTT